jgi:ElaB/YqjD/DUF883 family membrane-anchored ribosome-binding protein
MSVSNHPTGHADTQKRDEAVGDLGDLVDIVRAEVRREFKAVSEKAGELVERGKEAATDAKDRLAEKVSEKPLASLAIAAGVGVLVGLMIGRRRGE